MSLTNSDLINIQKTLKSSIPKRYYYLIGSISGIHPEPKCYNTAVLKIWICRTNRVQKGVSSWFDECRYNDRYSIEYKNKVLQKIDWLNTLLSKLNSYLPK